MGHKGQDAEQHGVAYTPDGGIDAFLSGLWEQNPVFMQVLGMCPTLAITNTVQNAIVMGLATLFVLTCSNAMVSMVRKLVPKQVRIATFILLIATAVTVVDYLVKALSVPMYRALGPFIPLIVANCIILGRAESFAAKNPVIPSAMDGLGVGAGFTFALACIGTVRETLGAGTFLGHPLFGNHFQPWILFQLPPGGFFALAMWLAGLNAWRRYQERPRELAEAA
ncbi:MAG: electron transport complex subunit E [Bryobacterales bacterium]|nr:electron transport complex subunit E [Bryobacterales bacterium]